MKADEQPMSHAIEQPAAPSVAQPSDAMVDAWFAAHFHNLGAQLDTPLYNRLHAAKEDLKVRLRAFALPSPQ